MKPRVLPSWEDPEGLRCVDILAYGDGSFGYTLCRRDPEDGHGWRHVDGAAGPRFAQRDAAEAAARTIAPWWTA